MATVATSVEWKTIRITRINTTRNNSGADHEEGARRSYGDKLRHATRRTVGRLKIRIAAVFFVAAAIGVPSALNAGFFPTLLSWIRDDAFAAESAGGHLYTYAERMETTTLRAALNVDPNPAKGGGDITIEDGAALRSEGGPAGTMVNIADQKASEHISIYVVRAGDSLGQIAKMFNVSVNTIAWANDVRGGLIREGQVLTILPVTGVRHTVAKGDTLASIAKKYKGDLDEIVQYNNIAADTSLLVGSVVIVPDGELGAPKTTVTLASGSSGGPSYAGYYIRPVVGGTKTQGIHGYNAVDLAAPVGTPILSSAAGTVIVSRTGGWNGGYGNYIVVRHGNGTQTLYAHTSANIVGVGQWVVQGQVIGYVGSTGRSTGPHVHFEIRGAKNPF